MSNPLLSLSLHELERISPSSYCSLQSCKLKGILSATHSEPLLPVSPLTRLGTVIHKFFKLAGKGVINSEEQLAQTWENEVKNIETEMLENKMEAHLVPLEFSAANFEIRKMMAFFVAQHLIDSRAKKKGKSVHFESEKWVETDDGKVVGSIDLVRKDDKYIEIMDYKTGNIVDDNSGENNPKHEYQLQLKLYAALYYSVYKNLPDKLSLIGLDRKKYDVDFTKGECLELLEQAIKDFYEINELINAGLAPEDFAQPSPESCRFCVYRPACNRYWDEHAVWDTWPFDVCGSLKSKKKLGNGLFKVVLLDKSREVSIRGLSQRHSFLNNCFSEVLFCNLGKDTSVNYFVEIPLTTGYILKS